MMSGATNERPPLYYAEAVQCVEPNAPPPDYYSVVSQVSADDWARQQNNVDPHTSVLQPPQIGVIEDGSRNEGYHVLRNSGNFTTYPRNAPPKYGNEASESTRSILAADNSEPSRTGLAGQLDEPNGTNKHRRKGATITLSLIVLVCVIGVFKLSEKYRETGTSSMLFEDTYRPRVNIETAYQPIKTRTTEVNSLKCPYSEYYNWKRGHCCPDLSTLGCVDIIGQYNLTSCPVCLTCHDIPPPTCLGNSYTKDGCLFCCRPFDATACSNRTGYKQKIDNNGCEKCCADYFSCPYGARVPIFTTMDCLDCCTYGENYCIGVNAKKSGTFPF